MTSPAGAHPSLPTERGAVLSIGSNLGDREAILREAVAAIAAIDGVEVTAASSIVETAAVKLHGVDVTAPSYLNAAVTLRTRLDTRELLNELQRIELEYGRVRHERWGDRTLDVDIVTVDGEHIDEPGLTVPHPRAADRVFVLAPWLEIEPDATLVGLGPVSELLARLGEPYRRYSAEPLL
ncbi:MAG: 2-amino-4-hydroxy-6-hydroxymethyldihydropteridine diphosphokinase [Salinibacterium sp.]|nr:2-amino-4-hydroxy-6-hydroxymethyldihydropteridine diphosphokinase [Salinibacterium sp.]